MEAARRATPSDAGMIAAWVEALRSELEPMRGGAVWSRRERRAALVSSPAVAALVSDPDAVVVVGTIDDEPVGVGIAEIVPLRDGDSLGVVHELYVVPDAREVGVGEVIVERLLADLAARGCIGVDALALPGHRSTKNFFETNGFVARQLTMHRSLTPERDADDGTADA